MASDGTREGKTRTPGTRAGGRKNGSRASDGRSRQSTSRRSASAAASEPSDAERTASATDAELAEATASRRERAARREAESSAPRDGAADDAPRHAEDAAGGEATREGAEASGSADRDPSQSGGDSSSQQQQQQEQKRPGGLAGLIQRRAREGSLDSMDVDFARAQRFLWDFVQDHYFRMETEGWHRLPDPPALIIGIHAAGIFPVEAWMFGLQWNRRFGEKRILHGTAHDALMATPLVGEYFRKMGVMSAARETVTEALEAGRDVIVYPGGDVDSLRPWTQRDEVKLAGRRGFVKQAIRSGVPIVPLAKTGGTDTMFTLPGGRAVARALGLKQLARIESLPLAVGLPWGVAPGVLPFLPLPAKLRIEILDPIYIDDDPERADDDEYVDMLYDEVKWRIEQGVARLKRKRSFPVFG
jgi:1-acyl-sn-glycerol-3-phosphate acyltransferase